MNISDAGGVDGDTQARLLADMFSKMNLAGRLVAQAIRLNS